MGNNPDLRARAARLLGERGDEKAIELLERDIPTAYAQARYEAQDAVWQIKSRLGLEAGRHPEAPHRLGKTKTWQDDEPLWQGFEKSLKSSNKAIRLEVIDYLATLAAKQEDYLQTLVAVTHTDPDRGVRIKATEHLASAFYSQVNGRHNEGKTIEPLNSIFDDLVQIAIKGDDDFVTAVFVMPPHMLQRFNSRPACQGMVARFLDGVVSPKIACRAACLGAFAFLGEADADVAKLGKTPERKRTMSAAVLAGLTSDYGRYKVDAILAASILQLTEAVPSLIAIISTAREWNYRMDAATALGKIGDSRALDALRQMADADPYVDQSGVYKNRQVAREAIQAIRSRATTRPSDGASQSLPQLRER